MSLGKAIKQKIDRAAIKLASDSLLPGSPNKAGAIEAAQLLCNKEFLQPPDKVAQLKQGKEGDFQFESSLLSHSAKNNTVHGRLVRARKHWQSRPFVILVHGWNAELHYLYILPRLARALARHDLNAALIELPYHLHRRPLRNDGMSDFISDDLPKMIQATHQAIADVHALALWCRAQGAPSVAVWGFSLGAWLTGLYLCHSPLPSAAVLTTPVSNLARGVQELAFCHPIRSSMGEACLDLAPLNLTSHRPQIPPENIQVVESTWDLFVPHDSYEELARAWSLASWEQFPQGHISILLSLTAMKRSIHWLKQRLDRPIPPRHS